MTTKYEVAVGIIKASLGEACLDSQAVEANIIQKTARYLIDHNQLVAFKKLFASREIRERYIISDTRKGLELVAHAITLNKGEAVTTLLKSPITQGMSHHDFIHLLKLAVKHDYSEIIARMIDSANVRDNLSDLSLKAMLQVEGVIERLKQYMKEAAVMQFLDVGGHFAKGYVPAMTTERIEAIVQCEADTQTPLEEH